MHVSTLYLHRYMRKTYAHTCTRTKAYMHAHTHLLVDRFVEVGKETYMYTYSYTHTHVYKHTQTYTHTHTHTHAYLPLDGFIKVYKGLFL